MEYSSISASLLLMKFTTSSKVVAQKFDKIEHGKAVYEQTRQSGLGF